MFRRRGPFAKTTERSRSASPPPPAATLSAESHHPKLRKLLNFFHSTQGSSPRRIPRLTVRQASADADAASSDGREERRRLFGDARRGPLLKQPRTETRSSDQDSLWRPIVPRPFPQPLPQPQLQASSPPSWASAEGSHVDLRSLRLQYLEGDHLREALHKVALQRLKELLPSMSIIRPKESVPVKQKRQKYKKIKSHTVNIMEKKTGGSNQQVFGISLRECILNDKKSSDGKNRCKSLDLHGCDHCSQLSLSADSGEAAKTSYDSLGVQRHSLGRRAVSDEMAGGGGRQSTSSEGLRPTPSAGELSRTPKLSRSSFSSSSPRRSTETPDEPARPPLIPKIVETCTDYLKRNGLSTLGLFRIAGSAKRCRQMRLLLDNGQELVLDEEEEAPITHDIATILKEYLRDLPDPLLSKDLYQAFLATGRLESESDRVEALRCLVALLPSPNADTLIVLLNFLQDVAAHAYDTIDDDGIALAGNKMTSENLATIFAPSLLRSAKPAQVLSESEHPSLIPTVQLLITAVDEIFTIPPHLVHRLLLALQDSETDAADELLERLRRGWALEESAPAEELATTVFYTSQEETYPDKVSREGSDVVVKTKTVSTHRIVYKVERGQVVGAPAASSSGESAELGGSRESAESEPFPELRLFIDDDGGLDEEQPPLIDPSKATRSPPALARLLRAPFLPAPS